MFYVYSHQLTLKPPECYSAVKPPTNAPVHDFIRIIN